MSHVICSNTFSLHMGASLLCVSCHLLIGLQFLGFHFLQASTCACQAMNTCVFAAPKSIKWYNFSLLR